MVAQGITESLVQTCLLLHTKGGPLEDRAQRRVMEGLEGSRTLRAACGQQAQLISSCRPRA